MDLSSMDISELKKRLNNLERKFNKYLKTDEYKWVIENMIPKSKEKFNSYKEYLKYLEKRIKKCSLYCKLKSDIEALEYEIYVRETIKIKKLGSETK